MLGSREEAEDAVQHTFMAAYKDLLGSEKDIQLRAWLYTIARNRCLSVLRARREQPSDEIEIASVDGLSTQVERRVDLQEMLRDLADLPPDQREALVLSEIGDMGHDEIALVLEVPKDKVKALVFQARSSLHQSRDARETSCREIQEMLATLTGGALRRTTLRRHVKSCAACQAFEADVKRQRRAMAAVLPVFPTVGFKDSALAAIFGPGGAGGAVAAGGAAAGGSAAAGGILSGGGASAIVAKVLVVAAVAGGGAAGVKAVSDESAPTKPAAAPTSEPAEPSGGGSAPAVPAAAPTTEPEREQSAKVKGDKPSKSKKGKRRGQDDRGKDFAKTRGKGKKRGLNGTQPGKTKAKKAKEKAKEKTQQRKARKQVAKQKATAKAKAKAKAQRPAKRATPAKPDPKPAPTPKPDPTPRPDPGPSIVPTIIPGADGAKPNKNG
jgi:RNA polymerase sigma factor (sigma-70 family)